MRRVVFKARFLGLVLLAMVAGAWPMAAQAAAAPGPAAGFTLLSAAPGNAGAVTCTNTATTSITTINGNVGSSGSVTNNGCTITGTTTAPVSAAVVADFNSTYNALKNVPCNHTPATLDLTQTLTPGVYCFPAAATATDKVLTLNGPATGIWLFKIGTAGTGALTGTRFSVVMTGGGNACNVNWWAAQGATLTTTGTPSRPFSGNILAGAAATVTGTVGATSALTLTGRVWARAGVTVTDSTIVGCASAITVPKTKCKSGTGTGNGEDENADQSKDTAEQSTGNSNKSASTTAGASQSSNGDSKNGNGKHDNDEGNKSGCDSDNSNHGDKQSKDR
jgi:hypothetical protein